MLTNVIGRCADICTSGGKPTYPLETVSQIILVQILCRQQLQLFQKRDVLTKSLFIDHKS